MCIFIGQDTEMASKEIDVSSIVNESLDAQITGVLGDISPMKKGRGHHIFMERYWMTIEECGFTVLMEPLERDLVKRWGMQLC